jgi:hypothetical protein
MTHTQAIAFLIQRLLRQFPESRIHREKTFKTKPRIVPDISIDLESGKRWIVVEVGSTQARKVGIYQQDPTIDKFLWYDNHSLKLVGVWDFRKHRQQVIAEDEFVDKAAEVSDLGKIKEETQHAIYVLRRLRQAEKKAEVDANAKTYGFIRDDKIRVLCPICLAPVAFRDAKAWFKSRAPWGMLVCKSCKWESNFDPITSKSDFHFVVELWNTFLRLLHEKGIDRISYDEFEKLLEDAFANYIPKTLPKPSELS